MKLSAEEVAERLGGRLAQTVIALDFDGTLAPIVDDPAAARPIEGVVSLLKSLCSRCAGVVVVSGRPVRFLAAQLPDCLDLVGLYGLEGIADGVPWEHPSGGVWREALADVAASAGRNLPEGARVELKDLSITLHYRGRPELASTVSDVAERLAERSGLRLRSARQAVELHPPIEIDKGTVIETRVGDAEIVLFVGDDVGDLAAFDALDRCEARGLVGIRVAVLSDEAPTELIERADAVLAGPAGVLELLGSLPAA